jgi:hypothetical protein
MAEKMNAEAFSQHLKTTFRVPFAEAEPLELELDEVAIYPSNPGDQGRMERFSLFFYGPRDLLLQQDTYRLEHDAMGGMDIFLVPIGRNDRGVRYQAVFNVLT